MERDFEKIPLLIKEIRKLMIQFHRTKFDTQLKTEEILKFILASENLERNHIRDFTEYDTLVGIYNQLTNAKPPAVISYSTQREKEVNDAWAEFTKTTITKIAEDTKARLKYIKLEKERKSREEKDMHKDFIEANGEKLSKKEIDILKQIREDNYSSLDERIIAKLRANGYIKEDIRMEGLIFKKSVKKFIIDKKGYAILNWINR